MPKNIQYWEDMTTETKKRHAALRDVRRRMKTISRPLKAVRRTRNRKKWECDQALWRKQYSTWVLFNVRVRRLEHRIDRVQARLNYYQERIEALRSRTAWDRLRDGVL